MNNSGSSERVHRRDFFSGAIRYAFLTALGLLAGFLAKTRRVLSPKACANQGFCNSCSTFASCSLPEAISKKNPQLRT